MSIRIFRTQRNLRESWLAVNEDGTATYHLRNFGSRLLRDGPEERTRSMSVREAKLRWPFHSKSIDFAVAEVVQHQDKSLEPTTAISAIDAAMRQLPKARHSFDRWRSREKRERPHSHRDSAAE